MRSTHLKGSYSLMRLIVSQDGEHTITIAQTDERCFSRKSNYDYSNCRIIIARIEQDSDSLDNLKIKFLKGVSGWDRDTHV